MAINIDLQPIFDAISTPSDAFNLQFSELIYEKYINARSVTDFHTVATGVKCGAKIPVADRGRNYDYMRSKEGLASQCDFNECDVTTTFSVKEWDTHEYNCRVSLCKADLECDFEKWWQMTGCNETDDLQNNFILFLEQWIGDALIQSHWTKIWFADNTYPNTSALYGSDGLFKQMEVATLQYPEHLIGIDENSNATYAEQDNLNPQRGFEVYGKMYDVMIQDTTMSANEANMRILTTRKLAVNYLQYLRQGNQVDCCFKSDVTQGVYSLNNLNIYGLPIVIVPEWDEIIRGTKGKDDPTPLFPELNDGIRWTNPHRAVLTYKENIPFGTCNEDKLNDVEVLYNPFNRNITISSEYEIGAKVLYDDEFVLALSPQQS